MIDISWPGPDLRGESGGSGPHASHQQRASHQTLHILFLAYVQDTFSNVMIALRMYLVLMIINCSAERSFSNSS